MDNKKIIFDEIDTSSAAKDFETKISKKYREPLGNTERFRTFFLNGEWGSGKSTFLDKTKQVSKKSFINVKLWEVRDERTVITIAFSMLHPVLYWFLKVSSYVLISLAILIPTNVNVGLTKIIPSVPSWVIGFGMILGIVALVHQFLKVKSDYFYIWLLPKYLKNKILIIDDFDRIDEPRQIECYKLFNILQGKLPIVFIGDYSKIINNNDKYLQKIIDRRIELPLSLSPDVVIKDIDNQFINKFGLKLNSNLFINETRLFNILRTGNHSLRELSHFVELLNYQLFELKKFDHVEIEQFILMVYLFLFYPTCYKFLMRNFIPLEATKDSIEDYFNKILFDETNEKRYFGQGVNPNYFIDEYMKSLTLVEANEIFADERKLKKELEKESIVVQEFYNFLRMEYHKFNRPRLADFNEQDKERDRFNNNKKTIERLALAKVAEKGTVNGITDFVLQELADDLISETKNEVGNVSDDESLPKRDKLLYEKLNQTLENFDLSSRIFFCFRYKVGSKELTNKLREKAIEKLKDDKFPKNEKYPSYLCYLAIYQSIIKYNDNENNIQEIVLKLNNKEFKTFFELMRVCEGNKVYTSITVYSDEKDIKVSIEQEVINEFKKRFPDVEFDNNTL